VIASDVLGACTTRSEHTSEIAARYAQQTGRVCGADRLVRETAMALAHLRRIGQVRRHPGPRWSLAYNSPFGEAPP
jgi:hypothetical protein